jgi:hypothetical protein
MQPMHPFVDLAQALYTAAAHPRKYFLYTFSCFFSRICSFHLFFFAVVVVCLMLMFCFPNIFASHAHTHFTFADFLPNTERKHTYLEVIHFPSLSQPHLTRTTTSKKKCFSLFSLRNSPLLFPSLRHFLFLIRVFFSARPPPPPLLVL